MPRPFSDNLFDLLKFSRSKEVLVEEHSTLELTLTGVTMPARLYYFATADLVINGTPYAGSLREGGAIKQSITRAVNRMEVVVENVISLLGSDWINLPDEIQGAKAKVGRYWRNPETGQEHHEILFRGVIQTPVADQDAVRLQILSDIYAASIGGGRRVARKCQWRFRDPNTCTYTGVEIVCNKLLNSTGGCSGRTNQHHYGGFAFIQPKNSVAGAASTSAPPNNQVVKTYDGVSYASKELQPFVAFQGALVTNDNTNLATRVQTNVIESANPTLEFRDTDGADFLMELNANILGLKFIGGATMMSFAQSGSKITVAGLMRIGDLEIVNAIRDQNSAAVFNISTVASAVNAFTAAGAATGAAPKLSATGTDTNIGIDLQPKGTGNVRGIFAIGQGFVAQANIATDSPFNGLANSSGTVAGGFGLALAAANFANIAAANDIVFRGGTNALGNVIITAHNGGDIKFSTGAGSTSSDTLKQRLKNNGFWVSLPQNIKTDTAASGNSTTVLTDLHSFSLPAGSLNANGDYLRIRYSGTFVNNANTKKIVIVFAGQTVHDSGAVVDGAGGWVYDIIYERLSATSIRATVLANWGAILRDQTPNIFGSGFIFSQNIDITGLTDLGANAQTLKVQAQSGAASNDITQNLSIIELTQIT